MPPKTTSQQTAAGGPQPGAGKGNSITKKEAVRQALKKLGKSAKPAQLGPYIKATFGLDMTPAHITTAKGELLRGKGKKGKASAKKPEATPAAAPQPAAAPAKGSRGGNGSAAGIGLQDIAAVKELLGRVGADNLRTLIDLLAK
jgi:hypothetical protein